MALIRILQRGAVSVIDYRCTSGPRDRPFTEVHAAHSIALVRKGSFGCQSRGRALELIPGAVLVGCRGDEYLCTHAHHHGGDECMSFQYAPELIEEIAPRAPWRVGAIPPLAPFMVLGARVQAAVDSCSDIALDELGLLLVALFAKVLEERRGEQRLSAQDRRRAIESALWIEAHAREPIDLTGAAQVAGWSNYHYLRVFSAVLGVTPHQYLVRSRLRTAARLLAERTDPVTEVAFDCGFNDVSNFVRTFGRAAGMSPAAFRRAARSDRNFFQESFAAHS